MEKYLSKHGRTTTRTSCPFGISDESDITCGGKCIPLQLPGRRWRRFFGRNGMRWKCIIQRMDADRNQSECICDRGRESEVWEINFIKIAD